MDNRVVVRPDGKVEIILELAKTELLTVPAETLRDKAAMAADAARSYFVDGAGKDAL